MCACVEGKVDARCRSQLPSHARSLPSATAHPVLIPPANPHGSQGEGMDRSIHLPHSVTCIVLLSVRGRGGWTLPLSSSFLLNSSFRLLAPPLLLSSPVPPPCPVTVGNPARLRGRHPGPLFCPCLPVSHAIIHSHVPYGWSTSHAIPPEMPCPPSLVPSWCSPPAPPVDRPL